MARRVCVCARGGGGGEGDAWWGRGGSPIQGSSPSWSPGSATEKFATELSLLITGMKFQYS